MTTGEDYAWFGEEFPKLEVAYCLTWVRGLSAPETLDRLGAVEVEPGFGIDEVTERGYERWTVDGVEADHIAVTQLGDWSLCVEANGLLGVTTSLIEPLSRGTEVVSWFTNVNGKERFYRVVDGQIQATFEPWWPEPEVSCIPEELAMLLCEVGFKPEFDEDDCSGNLRALFALAERLTGIRLTAAALRAASFTEGFVRIRRTGGVDDRSESVIVGIQQAPPTSGLFIHRAHLSTNAVTSAPSVPGAGPPLLHERDE